MKQIILNNQIFKQIIFNENYFINEDGLVYSLRTNKILKWSIDKDGYPRIDLYVNGKQKHYKIHKLVWITWSNIPINGLQINHKDDNKMNPNINNLYLGTQKQNIKDMQNNNNNVGHIWSLKVFDKKNNKEMTFCPAKNFIKFSGHSCASGSIKKIMKTNWFKKQYKIIYYKQIGNVTTMRDECTSVE